MLQPLSLGKMFWGMSFMLGYEPLNLEMEFLMDMRKCLSCISFHFVCFNKLMMVQTEKLEDFNSFVWLLMGRDDYKSKYGNQVILSFLFYGTFLCSW